MSMQETSVPKNVSLLTEDDVYLFKQGRHFRLYDKLGAHIIEHEGDKGALFAVWAPNAAHVSVIGDFNGWNRDAHALAVRPDGSGIWEGFLPGVENGALYKYHIVSRHNNYVVDKGDPFGFYWELPPRTASVVSDLEYEWGDDQWMETRKHRNHPDAPISVYEVHLGSWRRDPTEPARVLSCKEIAPMLAEYVKEMGFTHVEFLPVMEHPFYGSWGYQTVGYFAPASRYGTCQDFMFLVDYLHREGIGVIFDWVPSHFPSDEYGLAFFDGTHLYEHADARQGFHPDWHLLRDEPNQKLNRWVQDLNRLYRSEPALHELDFDSQGFEWVDFHDAEKSIISFLRYNGARKSQDGKESGPSDSSDLSDVRPPSSALVVCNFTPIPRYNYRVGVPFGGTWKEALNSDAREYGGSGHGNMGAVEASPASFYGKYDHSLSVTLPPLGMVVFKWDGGDAG